MWRASSIGYCRAVRAGRGDRLERVGEFSGAGCQRIGSGGVWLFSGFLNGPCGPKDAAQCEAVSAPRPARPSRQHPMRQIKGLVKAKPSHLQTNRQRGVVLSDGEPRVTAAGTKGSASSFNHVSRKRTSEPQYSDTIRGQPSSSKAESINSGVLTLGSPAGGTTRRRPPKIRLGSCGQPSETIKKGSRCSLFLSELSDFPLAIPDRGSCGAAPNGSGGAVCAAPWLRSGGCVRG